MIRGGVQKEVHKKGGSPQPSEPLLATCPLRAIQIDN